MLTALTPVQIQAGQFDRFKSDFARMTVLLAGAPGCGGATLLDPIEEPGAALIAVRWRSIDDHRAFSASPDGKQLKAILLAAPCAISPTRHYAMVLGD